MKDLPLAVRFIPEGGYLEILDQRCLPKQVQLIKACSAAEVEEAISCLAVRGAPAIGVAAAYGLVLSAAAHQGKNQTEFRRNLQEDFDLLFASRPTAINLKRGLDVVWQGMEAVHFDSLASYTAGLAAANSFAAEDAQSCNAIGEVGRPLIKAGKSYMTICNAGALATSNRYGTALAPFYKAHEEGLTFEVFALETSPVFQGARLTATELAARGLSVTVLCDSMAGALMHEREIDGIFIGADRIAANGDSANKIGSYTLACLAKFHGVPFYVCAPKTTFDPACPDGGSIPIEERAEEEIRQSPDGRLMVVDGAKVWNPAFDVVPAKWIDGILTDFGFHRPFYDFSYLEGEG